MSSPGLSSILARAFLGTLAVGTAAWLAAACAEGDTGDGKPGKENTTGGTAGGGGEGGVIEFTGLGSAQDPQDCDAAARNKSYVGCDFWPTVTANTVWSIFDYAVVIANTGTEPADVTVTGPGGFTATTTALPRSTATMPLPWVPALKGEDANACGTTPETSGSVAAERSAYHLTSTRPIIVYQFSALEFRGVGGPQGKDWSSCPGLGPCPETGTPNGCFSFTNDASILLPTAAMSGSYRVMTTSDQGSSKHFAVTGTVDGTNVSVRLGRQASILAGGPVPEAAPGETFDFVVNAGDVVQIVSDGTGDLGGSLVSADRPVQVLAGSACSAVADGSLEGATCDHLEESIQPAETLGKHYVFAAPTGPFGTPTPQRIRIFGNVDGTTLSYPTGAPSEAPTTIDAGEVIELGIRNTDVEILASAEIGVATFMTSADLSNPGDFYGRGDPSQSFAVAVEQFRESYVFLAPDDYDVSFVDVVMPTGAVVTLDEAPLPVAPTPIGTSGYGVARVRLGSGALGAHALSADVPFGVQVVGYGAYTSYQYPAGLSLSYISPPPN